MDLTVTERAPEREGFLQVEIDRFQGPLDLLLHLIRTQDVDVFDIPIARITEQFLLAIKNLDVTDLDGAGEFLEMAATLIRIKAQMLLPRLSEDDEEDPRAELVRRLLEYEQIREITLRLRVAEADRERRFGKGYIPVRPRVDLSEVPLETTWQEVFEAALRDPESLTSVADAPGIEDCTFEEFQYVPSQLYEDMTDEELPETGVSQLEEPVGEAWSEDGDELARRLPQVWAKFGG